MDLDLDLDPKCWSSKAKAVVKRTCRDGQGTGSKCDALFSMDSVRPVNDMACVAHYFTLHYTTLYYADGSRAILEILL